MIINKISLHSICLNYDILSRARAQVKSMSLPAKYIYACYQAPGYGVSLGETATSVDNGDLLVGDEPGLGVRIDPAALGEPIAEWAL